MNNITGKRMENALKNAKFSQKDLALKIGVSPAAVSQYIKGQSVPSEENIIKICKVLEIDPVWLKGYDSLDLPLSDSIRSKHEKLYSYYENMNEEGKTKLIAYACDIFEKYKKEEHHV